MDPITFTKVRLPFGWLGNMSAHPIRYRDKDYRTPEALFQALRFVGHPEIQEEIRAEKSPMAAKMVAKRHKAVIVAEGYVLMGERDLDLMRLCLRLKVEQHPDLRQALLDTGDQEIIEDSTRRQNESGLFWGAAKQDDGSWVGENTLGKLWMELRADLRAKRVYYGFVSDEAVAQGVATSVYSTFEGGEVRVISVGQSPNPTDLLWPDRRCLGLVKDWLRADQV